MKKKLIIKIGLIGTFFVGIVVLSIAAGYIYILSLNNTYFPNTIVSGIDISGMTQSEATNLINQKKDTFLNNSTELTLNKSSIKIQNKEFPIEIKVEETLNILNTINSDKTSIFEIFFPKKEIQNITLIVNIDENELLNLLETKFSIADIRSKNANFYFDEESNLNISEQVNGFIIDKEPLILSIRNSFQNFNTVSITLELIEETPEISKTILEEQKPQILTKLTESFTLGDPIYSDDWNIKLIDYPTWVTFIPDLQNTKIIINQEPLNAFIDEKVSKWLDLPAEDVSIFTDENGKVQIEGNGNDGKAVKRELLKKSIETALANNETSVIIPIEKIFPQIKISDDLKDLGIKERIAVGHTSFYGSTNNRVHNIKTGASKFNGTIIAPDEIFSFVKTLGPVDGSTGYKKELVIKEEGTIPEYGGGLCQVSTTFYRSILFGGLPIEERHPHSYKVSYYSQVLGDGLDATIYIGGPDLKFKNDTGSHILVQAYVQNDYELYIIFYGTSDGRHSELEGPYLSNYRSPGSTVYIDTPTLPIGATKQVEKSHTGFNALWYRHLTDKNGDTVVETLNTVYRAIPAKILRGTSPT